MMRDLGSRDPEFIGVVKRVRAGLLEIGNARAEEWVCVPMQGSGTFGIEAVISTAVPRGGQFAVVANGAYGRRMATIAKRHDIATAVLEWPETEQATAAGVAKALAAMPVKPSLLACVHCETTTGLVNPIEAIAAAAREHGVPVLIDSMSGFGALPVDCGAMPGVNWVVSSSNKCVEGVPGLSFILARAESLRACEGRARTLALDVYDQWRGLESDGQFRFTPPTHVLLALEQALSELKDEGGPAGRLARYARVQKIIVGGLRELGYKTLLPDELLSPIITSFMYPSATFDFGDFSGSLANMGYVIYPGKVSNAPCFRVGSIGRLREGDAAGLVRAVAAITRREGK